MPSTPRSPAWSPSSRRASSCSSPSPTRRRRCAWPERGALSQQLNAIESLASVDTICVDKTGTLDRGVAPRRRAAPVRRVDPGAGLAHALGRFAASSEAQNLTLDALARASPAPPEAAGEAIPFVSRRRWSGLRLDGVRYVLGAPELFPLEELEAACAAQQEAGRRVVGFGTATTRFPDDPDAGPPPLRLLGLAVLAEDLRRDTRATVAYLVEQGVEIVVLSGDSARTVASIAHDAGIPARGVAVDGGTLPAGDAELDRVVRELGLVGRISPDGKRRVVESLRRRGRYVAMVGDGVNDVPALKASRLSIAQGSGTQMAKAVADVVLVNGDFAAIPGMVAEGRRILRNLQRVTKLFVTKSVFAAFLIVAVGITPAEYPLLPRHLTIVARSPSASRRSSWPSPRATARGARIASCARSAASRSRPGWPRGSASRRRYLVSLNVFDLGLLQSRTAATSTLIDRRPLPRARTRGDEHPAGPARRDPLRCLFAVYLVVLLLPGLRHFFELAVPNPAALR